MLMLQLYLHFPFCKRKCAYCDFCSAQSTREEIERYCFALCREIELAAANFPHARVSTVFLGGGTPSIVPAEAIGEVLGTLRQAFDLAADVEMTAEANPGTLTESWLETVCELGVNRLSLGVQAAQDSLLKRLGRIHTFEQARQSAELAQRHGIENLTFDVMFGLPGQSVPQYLDTLDAVCALGAKHVSAYSLILEDGTPLKQQVSAGEVTLPDDDETADMYMQGIRRLQSRGLHQYEISNFARGKQWQCRHNLGYWQGAWYLGLGLNSHSMLPPGAQGTDTRYLRVANTSGLNTYLSMIAEGKLPIVESQSIGAEDAMFETMMLGLRTLAGVSEADFLRRHGQPMQEAYGEVLEALCSDGLARWDLGENNHVFVLTEKGLLLQNQVLLRLMQG